tara:strand:- start:43 stop:1083 length:1041 start_codon:yes stop_codon:yes gene_type:complete
MKDIYENWNLYKEEVELLQELENIFLEYSDKDMLNENVMAKVVEKINDYILKLSMKVVQLAAKAKSKALSLLSGAAGVVSKFTKKYPNLTKGILIVIGIGIVATVMTVSPDAAQADLVFQGQVVTEEQAKIAINGLVNVAENIEAAEAVSGTVQGFESDYYNAAEHIQDLVDAKHGSKEAEEIKGKLGSTIRSALKYVKEIESEDPKRFDKMVKAAEELAVISPEGTYGSLQAVDMSMFQGKDNIFDTVKGYIMDTAKNSGDRMAILDQNQNLIDLNTWRETGKFPEGASKQIQNLVDNFEALSKGENVTGGKMMKSDRFEYFKRLMDLGKNTTMQITTNKGVIQI